MDLSSDFCFDAKSKSLIQIKRKVKDLHPEDVELQDLLFHKNSNSY